MIGATHRLPLPRKTKEKHSGPDDHWHRGLYQSLPESCFGFCENKASLPSKQVTLKQSTHHKLKSSRNKGYGKLEVIISVMIIGVLVFLSIPIYNSWVSEDNKPAQTQPPCPSTRRPSIRAPKRIPMDPAPGPGSTPTVISAQAGSAQWRYPARSFCTWVFAFFRCSQSSPSFSIPS